MPELPEIENYLSALRSRVVGRKLERIRLASPFLVRSVDPSISTLEGKEVLGLRRLGKRIVFEFGDGEQDLFLVLHLMIAGRLHWKPLGTKVPGKIGLAAFDFENGTLTLTEAGSRKRASLYVVRGEAGLAEHDRGGLEVMTADLPAFRSRLTLENHTVKRALTDPHLFSGIGNAYSDEILHRAKMSPFKQTRILSAEEVERLYDTIRAVCAEWIERLREETGEAFPEGVTAFRPGFAVHGRYGLPCPVCGTPVQRIVYADADMNYCPTCQTDGRLLADRALSQLLRQDWPKTLEELEARKRGA